MAKSSREIKFRVTIFVLKEPDLVDLHTLFFDLRTHRPLVNTRTLQSCRSVYLSHQRSFYKASLGCHSEAVAVQTPSLWEICSASSYVVM